jgi:hypothetical protein
MVSLIKAAKRRRFLRPLISIAGLALASLALTGCIQLEGDLEIGPDARASGKLLYSIDKSLAELSGVKSLKDLRTSPDQIKATDSCKGTRLYESPSNYITECNLSRAFLGDDTFSSSIVGGQIVFTFKSMSEDSSSEVSFGATKLTVEFPGDIERVEPLNSPLVTIVNKRTVRIQGLATDDYDIRVYASCGKKCGASSSANETSAQDPNHPGYAIAKKSIGGMINQNLVFTRTNSPYTISKTLQIPLGLAVKVEPGVTIISKADTMFRVQGELLMEGEASRPINLNGAPGVFFLTKGAPSGSKIHLNFVNLNGGGLISTNSGDEGYVNWAVKNSRITNIRSPWHVWYPTNFLIEKSVFKNSGGIDIGFSMREEGEGTAIIRNNLFDGPSRGSYWIQNWASYGGALRVEGNTFKGTGFNILRIKYGSAFIDASGNFWGTTSSKKIEDKVLDAGDSLKYKSKIELSNPLPQPAIDTPRK